LRLSRARPGPSVRHHAESAANPTHPHTTTTTTNNKQQPTTKKNNKKQQQAEAETSTTADAAAAASSAPAEGKAPIYLGFKKGDYAPRAGRQGRVIVDDPKKYPGKEDLGVFNGAVGGWAGGEAALWKLREEVKAEEAARKQQAAAAAAAKAADARAAAEAAAQAKLEAARAAAAKAEAAAKAAQAAGAAAAAPIYLGYGKGEARADAPGRLIVDDPKKYPGKEDLGVFNGAVGGWAGGEPGLKQFVRDGEVVLREPGQPGGSQFSPVAVAALMAIGGAGGGLLLNGAVDVGEGVVRGDIISSAAGVDESTRTLLLAAVAILGGGGAVAAGVGAFKALQERVAGGAQKLAVAAAFWVGVFFAARYVLEL
jgi:hypothetical protein